MKRTFPFVAAVVLTLAGCAANDSTDAPPTSNSTIPTSTIATATSSASTNSPTTTITTETPTTLASAAETAPVEPTTTPYVVECLFGTPGPALWSDGTTAHSKDCYQQGMAGRGDYQCPATDAWVNDPSECTAANLGGDPSYDQMFPGGRPAHEVPYADGGTCPAYLCGYGTDDAGNPNPTNGEIQSWFNDCLAANTAEYCRANDPY